jgi:hypothetical protein
MLIGFESIPELVEAHGYPSIGRVFGLNGARVDGFGTPERPEKTMVDLIGTRREAYRMSAKCQNGNRASS